MDKTLDKYFEKFLEFPPVIMMVSFSHPIYQYFMKKALREGKPIDMREFEAEFERRNIKYDLID